MAQKPLVINFFGGPGAGKTTNALALTAALKRIKVNASYVPEYARELVLERRLYDVDQMDIYEEQEGRLRREIRGGMEVIVTDSPLIIQAVYAPTDGVRYEVIKRAKRFHTDVDVINVFLDNPRYNHLLAGRAHDRDQSQELDGKIYELLSSVGVPYEWVGHKQGEAIGFRRAIEWLRENSSL